MWCRQTVFFNGGIESTSVFLSKANFTAASRIIVYTESISGNGYLCGIKVFHRGHSPDILGEARKEARSFALEGELTYVSVYYTVDFGTSYRIRGLRFGCGSRCVDVGHLEGCVSARIQLSNVSRIQSLFLQPSTADPFKSISVFYTGHSMQHSHT